jgi:hypothetical protein
MGPWPRWAGLAPESADNSAEHAEEPRPEEPRTIEIGLGTLLMGGTGADATLGLTPYAAIETAGGLLVRPALVVGESVIPLDRSDRANATWLATRVDVCSRLPGSYARGRGIQLDLCGGAEAGLAHFAAAPVGYTGSGAPATGTTLPEMSLGPSLDLRGELGKELSIVIRGVTGVNVVRGGFTDTRMARIEVPWLSERFEVALSWRVR